ncbi:hypothetical protein [Paenibacillus ihumii]|uniref:hypothetical protein n=1 Tax=Paenibacillus ihumii TaxID=687436 RepID=UPI0006D7D7CD|nr:hypothetical protein [Paenibacillus ihumii]
MEEIYRQLGVVRRRMQWLRAWAGSRYGLITGLAAAAAWLCAGRLWPIEGLLWQSAGLAVLFTLVGLLWGFFARPVSLLEAARTMDRAETGEERRDEMATALSFGESDVLAAQWQRAQAAQYGAAYVREIKRRLPFPVRRKFWLSAAGLLTAIAVLAVLPNPMEQELAKRKEQREWVAAQKQETEEQAKELEARQLEPIAKEALSREIAELRRALELSKEPEDALDSVEHAMKSLKEMSDKIELKQREMEKWLEEWKANPLPEGLAQALQQQNQQALNEKMEDFRQKAASMSEEERNRLAQDLRQIAEAAPLDDEKAQRLAEALKKAAEALEKGNAQELEQALELLEQALQESMAGMNSGLDQAEAASALAAALAKQGMELAEQMAASGLAVSDTWSMGGIAEQWAGDAALANGEPGSGASGEGGEGQGAGQGQGQGGGQGSGSGSGGGNSGGSGTMGRGQGSATGQGAGLGSGGRELVTTPRDLKGSGNLERDGGEIHGGGGDVQKGGKSPVFDGVSRPYDEVYSDYAAEAKRSLERSELPQSVQSLVESYFTEIDPGY